MNHVNRIFILSLVLKCVYSLQNGVTQAPLKPNERMTGGRLARKHQFPYHVAIVVDEEFRCGGGLLKRNFVITAAHCLFDLRRKFDAYNMKILIDRTSIADDGGYRTYHPSWAKLQAIAQVEMVYVPKIYKAVEHWYVDGDIAILKLSPFGYNFDKWALNLPQKNKSYTHQVGIITGHGVNKRVFDDPRDPDSSRDELDGQLRYTSVKILTNEECKKAWRNQPVPKQLICTKMAKVNDGSLCDGDSGGPVVVDHVVVGVLSVGSAKCQPGIPEVFTRVSEYLDFIYKAMWNTNDPDIMTFNILQERRKNYNYYEYL